MTIKDNIRTTLLALSILSAYALESHADVPPPLRVHTETQAAPLQFVPSAVRISSAQTRTTRYQGTTTIRANSLRDLRTGRFPNHANPNRIAAGAR